MPGYLVFQPNILQTLSHRNILKQKLGQLRHQTNFFCVAKIFKYLSHEKKLFVRNMPLSAQHLTSFYQIS